MNFLFYVQYFRFFSFSLLFTPIIKESNRFTWYISDGETYQEELVAY